MFFDVNWWNLLLWGTLAYLLYSVLISQTTT